MCSNKHHSLTLSKSFVLIPNNPPMGMIFSINLWKSQQSCSWCRGRRGKWNPEISGWCARNKISGAFSSSIHHNFIEKLQNCHISWSSSAKFDTFGNMNRIRSGNLSKHKFIKTDRLHLIEMPMLWTWDRLFVAPPPPEAQDRRWHKILRLSTRGHLKWGIHIHFNFQI